MVKVLAAIVALATVLQAHEHGHDQEPIEGPLQKLWYNVLPGDGGTQVSQTKVLWEFLSNVSRPILCSLVSQRLAGSPITRVWPAKI